jgi:hypothetical protein
MTDREFGLTTTPLPAIRSSEKLIQTTNKEWVGLTDEEILADDVMRYHFALNGGAGPISKKGRAIIAAVETKLKDKNYD